MKSRMYFRKSSLFLAFLLLVALVSASCGEAAEATTGTESYSFEFVATFLDGSTKSETVETNHENVGAALLEKGIIAGDNGAYGLYVKSVYDVEAIYEKDGTYWSLYIDGEMAMSGVDGYKCADVATVEFKVAK